MKDYIESLLSVMEGLEMTVDTSIICRSANPSITVRKEKEKKRNKNQKVLGMLEIALTCSDWPVLNLYD